MDSLSSQENCKQSEEKTDILLLKFNDLHATGAEHFNHCTLFVLLIFVAFKLSVCLSVAFKFCLSICLSVLGWNGANQLLCDLTFSELNPPPPPHPPPPKANMTMMLRTLRMFQVVSMCGMIQVHIIIYTYPRICRRSLNIFASGYGMGGRFLRLLTWATARFNVIFCSRCLSNQFYQQTSMQRVCEERGQPQNRSYYSQLSTSSIYGRLSAQRPYRGYFLGDNDWRVF